MNIGIIGAGNIGGTLAKGGAAKHHRIFLGVRDLQDATVQATQTVCEQLGNTEGKIIIDAMNAVMTKPEPFADTFTALKNCTNADVVKCFNSTGFENMANPVLAGLQIEMFMAGGSAKAKTVAKTLA